MNDIEISQELYAKLREYLEHGDVSRAMENLLQEHPMERSQAEAVIQQIASEAIPDPVDDTPDKPNSICPTPTAIAQPLTPPQQVRPDFLKEHQRRTLTPVMPSADEDGVLRWYDHAMAGLPIGLVVVGGAIGGALGGAAYALNLAAFKRIKSLWTRLATAIGITGAAAALYFLIFSIFFSDSISDGGGSAAKVLDDDDYIVLATSPKMRDELELDLAHRIDLIKIRVQLAEEFPHDDLEKAQNYADEKGLRIKEMLTEAQHNKIQELFRTHKLLSVSAARADGEVLLAFPRFGEKSTGNRPTVTLEDGKQYETISSEVSKKRKENHIKNQNPHGIMPGGAIEYEIIYDDHIDLSRIQSLIKSQDDALYLLKHQNLSLRPYGLKWLHQNSPEKNENSSVVSNHLLTMLESNIMGDNPSLNVGMSNERHFILKALTNWAVKADMHRLEKLIREDGDTYAEAWPALMNLSPSHASVLASVDSGGNKWLSGLKKFYRMSTPEARDEFNKYIIPAWQDTRGIWIVLKSNKKNRIPFTMPRREKVDRHQFDFDDLPEHLQLQDFTLFTAAQKRAYISKLLAHEGNSKEEVALLAARLMLNPRSTEKRMPA